MLLLGSTFVVCRAHAQSTDVPTTAPTHEEADRAAAAGSQQARSAPLTATPTTTEGDTAASTAEEEEVAPAETSSAHASSRLEQAVFPPPPPPAPEDPDVDEETLVLPPWIPEWRLRLGLGATASTGGGSPVSFRLLQELEWMPHEAAPLLFSLTAGQVIGDQVYGLGGARVGLYGDFCHDAVVVCTGAVALRGGVIGTTNLVTYDIGGDGDARFRFDGVELSIRLGFFVVQTTTFVDAIAMVGAAF